MCLRGAREVQEKVLAKLDDDALRVFVVWMSVVEDDSRTAAEAAMKVVPDRRSTHFWAPRRTLGERFVDILKLPHGYTYAWDVYLAYGRGAEWKDAPPAPDEWMHQLSALRERPRLDGDTLRESVAKLIREAK